MIDAAPVDADGHVMETDDELRRYLPSPYERRRALTAPFPSLDGWPRSTRNLKPRRACNNGACFWIAPGVAGWVLYPTMGPAIMHIKDVK